MAWYYVYIVIHSCSLQTFNFSTLCVCIVYVCVCVMCENIIHLLVAVCLYRDKMARMETQEIVEHR